MLNKNFYINIALRLILLVSASVGACYYLLLERNIYLGISLLVLAIVTAILLIRYFNNINRWMTYFLLGIENEDTTLKPPRKTGNKSIDGVYQGMTQLNEMFKNAKIEMTTQEQYFKKVIKQSATGLFSINSNHRVININPAAIKLTQLYEYHHINSLKKTDAALPSYLTHEPLKQTSAIFENRFGQKLLYKLSEIKTSNEKLRLVAVSDITKELDNGEVEAWIKLARTLSHEIMNNIAPITTLSQVISGYFSKEQKPIDLEELDKRTIKNTIKGLSVIEDRSTGLMRFVENYRKFTKLPDPKIENINLSKLVNNSILAVGTYPDFQKLKLLKKVPSEIYIETDAQLLNQVVHNLLKNAYESLIHSNVEHATMEIRLFNDQQFTNIEIINNGPEIPAEIREQIFVPFFTTKENGSGVGLSLSKQMMLKMNGDIYLKKTEDQTTCFVVSFKH